jgi:hypothetical protein
MFCKVDNLLLTNAKVFFVWPSLLHFPWHSFVANVRPADKGAKHNQRQAKEVAQSCMTPAKALDRRRARVLQVRLTIPTLYFNEKDQY